MEAGNGILPFKHCPCFASDTFAFLKFVIHMFMYLKVLCATLAGTTYWGTSLEADHGKITGCSYKYMVYLYFSVSHLYIHSMCLQSGVLLAQELMLQGWSICCVSNIADFIRMHYCAL
jgi:hypothetical protein